MGRKRKISDADYRGPATGPLDPLNLATSASVVGLSILVWAPSLPANEPQFAIAATMGGALFLTLISGEFSLWLFSQMMKRTDYHSYLFQEVRRAIPPLLAAEKEASDSGHAATKAKTTVISPQRKYITLGTPEGKMHGIDGLLYQLPAGLTEEQAWIILGAYVQFWGAKKGPPKLRSFVQLQKRRAERKIVLALSLWFLAIVSLVALSLLMGAVPPGDGSRLATLLILAFFAGALGIRQIVDAGNLQVASIQAECSLIGLNAIQIAAEIPGEFREALHPQPNGKDPSGSVPG